MSNTFGNNLKKYRTEKKIGINELGRKIGVSGAYISALETGKKQNPSLDMIGKLSNALNIPSSFLTSDEKMNIFEKFNKYIDKEKLNLQIELARKSNPESLFLEHLGYHVNFPIDDEEEKYYVQINDTEYTYSQFMTLIELIKSCINNTNELLKNN